MIKYHVKLRINGLVFRDGTLHADRFVYKHWNHMVPALGYRHALDIGIQWTAESTLPAKDCFCSSCCKSNS